MSLYYKADVGAHCFHLYVKICMYRPKDTHTQHIWYLTSSYLNRASWPDVYRHKLSEYVIFAFVCDLRELPHFMTLGNFANT